MRSTTRALLIVFMIALLPLRSWAGEVMATEMASHEMMRAVAVQNQAIEPISNAIESEAAGARIHWLKADFHGEKKALLNQNQSAAHTAAGEAATHDCDGHGTSASASANATSAADTASPSDSHCNTCPACQACHTVALSASGVSLNAVLLPSILPRPAADHFASATAALGQKPPIS